MKKQQQQQQRKNNKKQNKNISPICRVPKYPESGND